MFITRTVPAGTVRVTCLYMQCHMLQTHTLAHVVVHSNTHTGTHTHTNAHTLFHTHTLSHTHTHTYKHTLTRTHTNTHTHTHTHTRTHTHTPFISVCINVTYTCALHDVHAMHIHVSFLQLWYMTPIHHKSSVETNTTDIRIFVRFAIFEHNLCYSTICCNHVGLHVYIFSTTWSCGVHNWLSCQDLKWVMQCIYHHCAKNTYLHQLFDYSFV